MKVRQPRRTRGIPTIGDRIQAICHVAEVWLERGSPWMARAMREVPRCAPYSGEMVKACLESTFANYTPALLQEWIVRERIRGIPSASHPEIFVLLPSTVFAAGWQAATAAWLVGAKVVFKPSRREPLFPMLLSESIGLLAGHVLPLDLWRGTSSGSSAGLRADAVQKGRYSAIVAYGRDETLCALRKLQTRTKRWIEFGTRISVAYVGRSLRKSELKEFVRRAAWDIALYETQGCLSPQCFYFEEGGEVSAEQFGQELAHALRQLDARLPRRDQDQDKWVEESFFQRWRFRESQKRARVFGNCVILQRDGGLEPCGLKRVVHLVPLNGAPAFLSHSEPWNSRLSTIAVSDAEVLKRLQAIRKWGLRVRFCEVGQMHEPPPWWRNGGISLLREFSQLVMKDR